MTKWADYLCEYRFGDGRYSISIPARDEQEARQRLRAIGTTGEVNGLLVASYSANALTHFPLSILIPAVVAVRNFFHNLLKGQP